MKRTLTNEEKTRLNKQIAEAEKQTNIQIVLATIKRCDSYAEIPWIAFAFGISVAGFLVFLFDFFFFSMDYKLSGFNVGCNHACCWNFPGSSYCFFSVCGQNFSFKKPQ